MKTFDCYVYYSNEWVYICSVEAKNSHKALEVAKESHGFLNFSWRVSEC